jgi:hypothetical protein
MLSRAPAFPQKFPAPVIVDALRRSARPLVLMGVLIAVATFAAFAIIAPQQPRLLSAELSVIAGTAALLFGLALIVATAALRNMPQRNDTGRVSQKKKRAEPVLTSSDEPILREIPDADIAAEAKTFGPGHSSSRAEAFPELVSPNLSPNTFADIDKLAAHLKERRLSSGGQRAMVTSAVQQITPFSEALALAKALADSGAQTILIDWSPRGEGFAPAIGVETRVGWNELLANAARFDEIIQRLPGSPAQVIASGKALRGGKVDADLLNLALDALDEVYDHIIVTARLDEARVLFECIEGRFDAGITIVPSGETPPSPEEQNIFIGFEVVEIDLVRFQRSEPSASAMTQRIARATRPREPVARPT